MKKAIFWFVILLIPYLFLEGVSFLTLLFFKETRMADYSYGIGSLSNTSLSEKQKQSLENLTSGKTNYIIYSSSLGWTIKPNGFASDRYLANSKGIRANKEYSLLPAKNKIRISSFGDSFTHCDDVKNEETWQQQLNRANSNLEVINFGVGAFGLDQAFLRYKQDGIHYKSDIIFIGFMAENIFRNVNVFRPFYLPQDGLSLAKPRFIIKNGELFLLENPIQKLSQYKQLIAQPEVVLPKLGVYDHYFQIQSKQNFVDSLSIDFLPSIRLLKSFNYKLMNKNNIIKYDQYNQNSEAFQVTVKIFEEFRKSAIKHKSLPIIILFPSESDIIRYRHNKTKIYTPLLKHFKENNYPYIDIMDAFDKYGNNYGIRELFKGHYSPLSNQLVAKYILEYLQEQGLSKP
jgi:hypothetical protein